MIDLSLLREDYERVSALLKKKDPHYDVQTLFDLDQKVRKAKTAVEELRSQKNECAQQGKKGITPELREQSIAIGKQLKEQEEELVTLEQELRAVYLLCPNIPLPEVPEGGKEANKVVKVVGDKPTFSFQVQNHVDLGTNLGWFDFQAARTMSGNNFIVYNEPAVNMLYSLASFMLKNNKKHGFSPRLTPYLINESALEVASNFPKFRDQVYAIEKDNLFLSPTSEVNLTNIYRDSIIDGNQLPLSMTAWTSCFRREAGAYGSTERGLIRIHQFEKVELYTLCKPENSAQELDRMVACAEDILQQLGLHYRISLLATQDASFQSAKTFDIEVWLPGQGEFYEVSSCSNCTDFQARRAKIRYKESASSKTTLVHTLNASSLALPRLMVALMETYQQADGTIALPAVLQEYSFF